MRVLILLILACLAGTARADETRVQLYAAPELVESGLIQHIRPRFSLKTQVGVDVVDGVEIADLVLGTEGRALFSGLGQTWHLDVQTDHAGAARFADWLTSEVGRNTIQSFAPDGEPLFTEPQRQQIAAADVQVSGDADLGRNVSKGKCGRCHATGGDSGGFGMGSAPSFAVMRGFDDWNARFAGFYFLKPHPSFTQLAGVTDPFPADRPSPIAPIELTLDELEAILAYVSQLPPADLGDPLQHQ